MRIAITGSHGFVGKALVNALLAKNEDLILIDRAIGMDLVRWNDVKGISNFNILVHLAANSYVPDSFKKPREFFFVNSISTLNALELCKINSARMIYISSYVYGEPKYLPVDELHPVNPTNPYTQSKIIGEQLCESYNRDFNVPVTIIRPFNLYGNGQNKNFLVPSILRMLNSEKIILKDSRPKRDLLFLGDFITLLVCSIYAEINDFEVINVGFGRSHSIKEIVDQILELTGIEADVQFLEEMRPGEIMNTVADISKARKLFSWEPMVNLNEGLKRIINNQFKGFYF